MRMYLMFITYKCNNSGEKASPLEVCSQKAHWQNLQWQNCTALSTEHILALAVPVHHTLLLGLGQELYWMSSFLTSNAWFCYSCHVDFSYKIRQTHRHPHFCLCTTPTTITHLDIPTNELPPLHQCWFATVALRHTGHGIHCTGNTCTSSVNCASHAKKHWHGLSRKESLDAVVVPVVIRNKQVFLWKTTPEFLKWPHGS